MTIITLIFLFVFKVRTYISMQGNSVPKNPPKRRSGCVYTNGFIANNVYALVFVQQSISSFYPLTLNV